jgi:hypothetical protein
LAFFVEDEFEAHAVFIIWPTDEAVILLHFCVGSFVAVGLAGHGGIVACSVSGQEN